MGSLTIRKTAIGGIAFGVAKLFQNLQDLIRELWIESRPETTKDRIAQWEAELKISSSNVLRELTLEERQARVEALTYNGSYHTLDDYNLLVRAMYPKSGIYLSTEKVNVQNATFIYTFEFFLQSREGNFSDLNGVALNIPKTVSADKRELIRKEIIPHMGSTGLIYINAYETPADRTVIITRGKWGTAKENPKIFFRPSDCDENSIFRFEVPYIYYHNDRYQDMITGGSVRCTTLTSSVPPKVETTVTASGGVTQKFDAILLPDNLENF